MRGDTTKVLYVITNKEKSRHEKFTIPHDIGNPGTLNSEYIVHVFTIIFYN